MPEITVEATITLTFDTEEGFVSNPDDAVQEMVTYLFTGPSPGEFVIEYRVSE